MEHAADGAADRAQNHRDDEREEDAENRREVQQLLHLGRVLVVESEHGEERAEEKDLRHQRLNDAALKTGDQRDHHYQDDDDVDDHGSGSILEDGYVASPS